MKNFEIFENGSTWLKADFHLHTKSDSEFNYSGQDFILDFVNSLKSTNTRIGAVTNHNKFNLSEFKELKKTAIKKEIYLLPGIEFSIKDGSQGIHLLIVFSEEWIFNQENKDYINDFIISAFTGISNYDKPPYPNSLFDLRETYNKLNEFRKDYFFILAHVDDKNGLFQELQGRNLEAFIKQEAFSKVLAIQKSGNKQNYEKLCNYAGRSIACVEGTDYAKNGLEAIINNQRLCFLKIGDFNFDTIKFALIAHNERVRLREKPPIRNSYIKSIEFIGGALDGQRINLSPELNSLVGIRGSGKSAIIEALRYVLGISLTNISVDQEYKNSLVEFALGSGGKVVLTLVDKNGDTYRIEKILKHKEEIYKDNNLLNEVTLEAIIQTPLYFGQKDLSNKDIDFEADLVKRLIGNKPERLKKQIEFKKQEIIETLFYLKKIENIDEQKKEIQTKLDNAKYQLNLLEEKKFSEKLKTQVDFEKDLMLLSDYSQKLRKFINELENTIKENENVFDRQITLSETNKKYEDELISFSKKLKTEGNELLNRVNKIEDIYESLTHLKQKIQKEYNGLKEEFASIKRQINDQNLDSDKFIELQRIIQTQQIALKEIENKEQQKNDLQKNLMEKLSELNNLWYDEFRSIYEEIGKINQSQNKLKIEIEYKGRIDLYLEEMKQYFRGTRIKDNSYQEIINSYKDFIEIYKDKSRLQQILTQNQLTEFERIFNESLSELLTFRVEDKITIKYNDKELRKHSLGQRASALILFLLSQKEQDILIIDQPEDDLDNQTIYDEVIREITKLKSSMQFIFATHNANIPVLGDCEKVVVCNFEENKIKVNQGTLDNPEIQKSIIDIMEGGKEAFKRRKEIYNIWKS